MKTSFPTKQKPELYNLCSVQSEIKVFEADGKSPPNCVHLEFRQVRSSRI